MCFKLIPEHPSQRDLQSGRMVAATRENMLNLGNLSGSLFPNFVPSKGSPVRTNPFESPAG